MCLNWVRLQHFISFDATLMSQGCGQEALSGACTARNDYVFISVNKGTVR